MELQYSEAHGGWIFAFVPNDYISKLDLAEQGDQFDWEINDGILSLWKI